jgi:hypothetical protein
VHGPSTFGEAGLEAAEKLIIVNKPDGERYKQLHQVRHPVLLVRGTHHFLPRDQDLGSSPDPGVNSTITLGMSALCLAVALGSAMPTGNLPAQAEDLHVSNEAIFISIKLGGRIFDQDHDNQ